MYQNSTDIQRKNRQTLKRILRYIRPYRGLVILSLGLSILTVGLTLYIPILTGHGVDAIVGKGQVDFAGLLSIIISIAISISVTASAQWVMNHINNKITYHIVRDLRIQAFNHLQELPLSYIDQHSSGDLLSRVISRSVQGGLWITIMNNLNVAAVAVLADIPCVLLAEGVEAPEDLCEKCAEEGIFLLGSDRSAYELAAAYAQNQP